MKNEENQPGVKHKYKFSFIDLKYGSKGGREIKLKRVKGFPTILHT